MSEYSDWILHKKLIKKSHVFVKDITMYRRGIPFIPKKCWGKKVKLIEKNKLIKLIFNQLLFKEIFIINGDQKIKLLFSSFQIVVESSAYNIVHPGYSVINENLFFEWFSENRKTVNVSVILEFDCWDVH